jgi:hypothetical protein
MSGIESKAIQNNRDQKMDHRSLFHGDSEVFDVPENDQ